MLLESFYKIKPHRAVRTGWAPPPGERGWQALLQNLPTQTVLNGLKVKRKLTDY